MSTNTTARIEPISHSSRQVELSHILHKGSLRLLAPRVRWPQQRPNGEDIAVLLSDISGAQQRVPVCVRPNLRPKLREREFDQKTLDFQIQVGF